VKDGLGCRSGRFHHGPELDGFAPVRTSQSGRTTPSVRMDGHTQGLGSQEAIRGAIMEGARQLLDGFHAIQPGSVRRESSGDESKGRPKRRKKLFKKKKQTRAGHGYPSDSSDSSSDESSSGDDDGNDGESDPPTPRLRRQLDVRRGQLRRSRLPSFTGKEAWKVWHNRFEDVASRYGWDDDEKLDELLPKLQGTAGEFVFDQLPKKTRSKYSSLVKELKNRFRVVETAKSFTVKFSNRGQKPSETAEQYAAELKRLYDKGFPRRDRKTRDEDLLRRFLDGLLDDRARQQVEYVKEPKTIDEAVYEVVNFLEMRRKSQSKRNARIAEYITEESDSDDDRRVARLPERGGKTRKGKEAPQPASSAKADGDGATSEGDPNKTGDDHLAMKMEMAELRKGLHDNQAALEKCLKALGDATVSGTKTGDAQKRQNNQPGRRGGFSGNRGGRQQQQQVTSPQSAQGAQRPKKFTCYRCGREGHFARECLAFFGQMQMVAQSAAPVGGAQPEMQESGCFPPNGNGTTPAATK